MRTQAQPIHDTVPFVYRVIEDKKGGRMVVKGVFQRGGVQNENRRRYPTNVLSRAIQDRQFQEAMKGNSLFGELDHPGDGETKLARSSHFIPDVQMTEDGTVIGTAVIMDTSRGKDLKEIFRAGGRVGISSRGSGSLATADDGVDEVQEDFKLDTFDFVAAPSTPGAYPEVISESTNRRGTAMTPRDRFHNLREQAQRLLAQKPSLMTESNRADLRVESEGVEVELNRLAEEDKGYRSLCNELIEKLSRKRRNLESKSAPPSVEKIVAASEAVMVELARQLVVERKTLRRRIAEATRPLRQALRRKMAEVVTGRKHLAAAYAVGEGLAERVEKGAIREHVAKLIEKNPRLAKHRASLGNCTSIEEVNKFARRLATPPRQRITAPGRRVVERKVTPGRQPTLARRGAPNISQPLSERVDDKTVAQGDRLGLKKRLQLQY